MKWLTAFSCYADAAILVKPKRRLDINVEDKSHPVYDTKYNTARAAAARAAAARAAAARAAATRTAATRAAATRAAATRAAATRAAATRAAAARTAAAAGLMRYVCHWVVLGFNGSGSSN